MFACCACHASSMQDIPRPRLLEWEHKKLFLHIRGSLSITVTYEYCFLRVHCLQTAVENANESVLVTMHTSQA